MRYSKLILVAMLGALGTQTAGAAPTAAEAAELGKSLTAFGAIKAGNKEGTIPEYTGGICTPPADYKPKRKNPDGTPGGAPYVDPFAADKPLFKITAADMAKYADKLDDGTKQMLTRFPQSFYLQVYPTRRSACFSNFIYENTIKNVMKPKIVSVDKNPSLTDAHAQIPFPIPKNGLEAMWNSAIKPEPVSSTLNYANWLVDSSGNRTFLAYQTLYNQNTYWDNSLTSIPADQPYWLMIAITRGPTGTIGNMTQIHYYLRPDLKGNPAWSYIPGQRRVRMAPEFAYDGLASSSAGILLYDESNGFQGNMDRFEFKLVGRKEMYVPYNDYAFMHQPIDKVDTPNHWEPSQFRFELHRVWMVEATLKPAERHVQKKKIFYIDEDSWNMVIMNGIDQANKVHHHMYLVNFQAYDKPEIRNTERMEYDFAKRAYLHSNKIAGEGDKTDLFGTVKVKPFPQNYFTPENMAGFGIR